MTMSPFRTIVSDTHLKNSDSRLQEASLVRLCLDVAASALAQKATCQQAQTFWVAAMLLRGSHPEASRNLKHAYDIHQQEHGCAPQSPETVIEQGGIIGLARFRDALRRKLTGERRP
jgi:hypothetical protein